jgi:hypothetical protein
MAVSARVSLLVLLSFIIALVGRVYSARPTKLLRSSCPPPRADQWQGTKGRGADDDAQAAGVTGDADTEIVDIGAEDKQLGQRWEADATCA